MYVILVECICKLEGRVLMLHWMAVEDMHNIRFSLFCSLCFLRVLRLYLFFSLLCNLLMES